MTFRGLSAHVPTALSLQSQLDLEGSGGSENRRYFGIFLRCEEKCICEASFLIFSAFRRPMGARGFPKWLPKRPLKWKNSIPVAEWGPERSRSAVWVHLGPHCGPLFDVF